VRTFAIPFYFGSKSGAKSRVKKAQDLNPQHAICPLRRQAFFWPGLTCIGVEPGWLSAQVCRRQADRPRPEGPPPPPQGARPRLQRNQVSDPPCPTDPDPTPDPTPDPDPAIFVSDLQDDNSNFCCFLYFLRFTFWSYIYINCQRLKVIKKSQNSGNRGFSYYFCLIIEGSGARTNGSGRPKNIRIRIRNT
jgi:hypothetical protein